MSRNQAKILDIPVNSTSNDRVLVFVRERLIKGTKFSIVTPNPEIILQAQKDKKLAKILNSADLALPDGYGVVWATKLLGKKEGPREVVRGREVFVDLVELAAKNKWKVFLLGGESGVSSLAAKKLARQFRGLKIKSAQGPFLDQDAKPVSENDIKIQKEVVSDINKFKPQLLFLAFGAPKQEKFVAKWLPKLDIGGAMTVGGSFDFYSGKTKLPPKVMQGMHLEWLWRLIQQPSRLPRIFKATVVFPIKVILSKLR